MELWRLWGILNLEKGLDIRLGEVVISQPDNSRDGSSS
jgi:hypothetical protein